MAAHTHVEDWTGTGVSVGAIERELARLRCAAARDDIPDLRTSVMTHIAWVPEAWLRAAEEVLAGLAERHPSRLIVLTPDRDAGEDAIDGAASLVCFSLPGQERHVCTEVIRIRLRGRRALAPASIVVPLLISDLPVFLRWRGEPPFGEQAFEELTGVADRLVVDSAEGQDVPAACARVCDYFDRTAVSDIAWARTFAWRAALASLWPSIAELSELRVAGPLPEALLLAGWLRSRLRRHVELIHDEADEIELVAVDGERVSPARAEPASPADLLSNELDRFTRDPVYEDAVRAAVSPRE